MKKYFKIFMLCVLIIVLIGYLVPENFIMPVSGAGRSSYNPESFWYYPWGKSVTHKGVDIFSKEGTPVVSATSGIVVFTGNIGMGGNVILVLGPKWRLHYYAHLRNIEAKRFSLVSANEIIGAVGTTGNAAGKPAHLHYALGTIIPYLWRIDRGPHGLMKMIYLDPTTKLNNATQ